MSQRFSILFLFKKPKNYSEGPCPLYMRVTADLRRFEISTFRKWDPQRWDHNTCRALGNKEDSRTLNAYLDSLRKQVQDAYMQLLAEGIPVTAQNLRMKYEGKSADVHTLVAIFEDHNEKVRLLVGKDFAYGTLKRYKSSLNHIKAFLASKYQKEDIDIQELNYSFVTAYEFWLKSESNCDHNTAIKYVGQLRKIINICLKHGWLERDPFVGFKMKKKEVIREVLTQGELDRIASKKFGTSRLDVVRDIFLFSCYTGLAYSDVKKLKQTELVDGIDGGKWISVRRTKTDTPSRIPLLAPALKVIQKYENHPVCVNKDVLLPTPSNQKMNAYLKEIADVCGINKKMTFHMARHTFATTVTLTNGVPIETVGRMLGHRNLRTTQHYAKILDQKVSEDMTKLKSKLDGLTTNPDKL